MNQHVKILRDLFLQFLSKIYGVGIWSRNKLFDIGLKRQRAFDIPVIVVGNIAIGGTGKTPHTEYIISLLAEKYNIGVLSRGYKRSTSGFVLATNTSTPYDIGDEPYQIYKKYYGRIKLAVCEDRCVGIDELRKVYPDINLILLDDAFQHRYVKPDISIVLMEYNRMPYEDHLLPYGRLRESTDALRRASMVIITKCPEEPKLLDFRIMKNHLNLYPDQGLFFSKYKYGNLVSVFPEFSKYIPYLQEYDDEDTILSVTGIANPKPFTKYLRSFGTKFKSIRYPDHHQFERKDLEFIANKFIELPGKRKIIITTEKDAVRMATNPYFPQDLKPYVFYLPIDVSFIPYLDKYFDESLNKKLSEIALNKHN